MKIVREHINEKFESESDPIEDMGISRKKYYRYLDLQEKLRKYFPELIPNNERIVYVRTHFKDYILTNYMIVNSSTNYWRKVIKEFFEKEPYFEFESLRLEKTTPYTKKPFLNFKYVGD